MGLSDRDYQKQNYDRATGNSPRANDSAYRNERKGSSPSQQDDPRSREKLYRKPPGYYEALNSQKKSTSSFRTPFETWLILGIGASILLGYFGVNLF